MAADVQTRMLLVWTDLVDLVRAPHRALLNPRYFPLCAGLVFCLEVMVLPVIMWRVPCKQLRVATRSRTDYGAVKFILSPRSSGNEFSYAWRARDRNTACHWNFAPGKKRS